MNLIGKEYREIGSGNVFKIIDVYQNIAITNEREKIDVRRLLDQKYYIPSGMEMVSENSSEKKFEIKMDDHIDPNRFLNNERTYSMFAEAIKSIPEDKIPKGETEIQMPTSSIQIPPPSNESAVIIDNNYDEKEELMRKYGMNQNQDLDSYNKKFERFLADETPAQTQFPEQNRSEVSQPRNIQYAQEPKPQQIFVDDPITIMFKNVKKSVNFKFQLQIENKIPRTDFIEMMEDSYETSIIEFFAEEFTNSLLQNPNLIKKKISDEIRRLVYGEVEKKVEKKSPKKTATKVAPKKGSSKNIPPPPPPPTDRIIKEGEEPVPPNRK